MTDGGQGWAVRTLAALVEEGTLAGQWGACLDSRHHDAPASPRWLSKVTRCTQGPDPFKASSGSDLCFDPSHKTQ